MNYIKQKLTHRPVLFALLTDAEDTISEPDKLKRTFEIYKGQRGTDNDFFVALTVFLKLGEANGCREDLRRAFNDLEEIDVDHTTPEDAAEKISDVFKEIIMTVGQRTLMEEQETRIKAAEEHVEKAEEIVEEAEK